MTQRQLASPGTWTVLEQPQSFAADALQRQFVSAAFFNEVAQGFFGGFRWQIRNEEPPGGRQLFFKHFLLPKISSACRHSLLEKLIQATVQRCNGVPDRKAGSAEKNPARLAKRLLWFIRRTEAIVAENRLRLSGVALVSVMKSSDLRNHYDASAFWLLHGSRFRSIFGQQRVSACRRDFR